MELFVLRLQHFMGSFWITAMQPSQLACPQCGSTLNFGTEIKAGSPVECLICMHTFIAESNINPVAARSAAAEAKSADPVKSIAPPTGSDRERSEEHTSEPQSR